MLVGGVDAGMSASFTNMNIQGDVASLGGVGGATQAAGGAGGDSPQAALEIKDIQLLSHATKEHLSAFVILGDSDDPNKKSSIVDLAVAMYSAAAAMQAMNQLNSIGAAGAGAAAGAVGAAAGVAGIMGGGMMA